MKTVVQNLAGAAELADAGVDERTVVHVFVVLANHGVDDEQRALEQLAALVDKPLGELEKLADRGGLVMENAVGPEDVVVDMPGREEIDHLLEKRLVAHPPGDAAEIHPQDTVGLKERDHVVIRAELGDIVPRVLVDGGERRHDVEREGRGKREHLARRSHLHGIVREPSGGREVEEVFHNLRVVGLEIHMNALRVLPVVHRHGPFGNLEEHIHPLAA